MLVVNVVEWTNEPAGAMGVRVMDRRRSAELLDAVIDDVRVLFHRLKAVAEQLHGLGEPSAARRSVLRDLAGAGPQTVPMMARKRPVSRQHIQTVVNGLLEDGLVELKNNPSHRRSHLVGLTAAGVALARQMATREQALMSALDLQVETDDLVTTHRVLCRLRERLEPRQLDQLLRWLDESDR